MKGFILVWDCCGNNINMMDGSRLIPTHYDGDFWRTSPLWERRPLWERQPRWERPSWEIQPFQPLSSTPPFPTSFPPPPPPNFYPVRERQFGDFEGEMRRMNDEMNKMMSNMSRMNPMSNVDDWRLSENFKMDNPVQTMPDGSRKFLLEFDMRQFKPEEIQVRTAGNTLSVYAKHEEKDTGKSVFREYNRSYLIPKDVQPDRLTSKLSTGGVLTIEAPLPAIEGPREKLIPIKHN